jgi:hypothetical protein
MWNMDALFSKEALGLYKQIIEKMKTGATLSGDAALIAEAIGQHPEFTPFWSQGEQAFQPQEIEGYIVNPLVHVGLHVATEKQLADETTLEASETLSALMKAGMTRHEAIHKIAALWGDHYFRSIRRGNPMDQIGYLIELQALGESVNPNG